MSRCIQKPTNFIYLLSGSLYDYNSLETKASCDVTAVIKPAHHLIHLVKFAIVLINFFKIAIELRLKNQSRLISTLTVETT